MKVRKCAALLAICTRMFSRSALFPSCFANNNTDETISNNSLFRPDESVSVDSRRLAFRPGYSLSVYESNPSTEFRYYIGGTDGRPSCILLSQLHFLSDSSFLLDMMTTLIFFFRRAS